MALNFVVIYGSVRSDRQGIKAARFIIKHIEARGHQAILIDPVEYQLPLIDKMYKEYPRGEAPYDLEKIAEIFRNADAFVIVSGEYNHIMPPALANLMAYFMNEYFWRPAGIASYSKGSFGGVRAASHLRDMLSEIGLVTIPSTFPVSKIRETFDENGKALDPAYDRRIQRFLNELEWYSNALKEARKEGVPYE
jgi:NAD(P)H-dependent FMN reductase